MDPRRRGLSCRCTGSNAWKHGSSISALCRLLLFIAGRSPTRALLSVRTTSHGFAQRPHPILHAVPSSRTTTTIRRSTARQSHKDISWHASPTLYLPARPDDPIKSILAPMVAASDYPFRCLCRQYVDLSFTQMLHAKHLVAKPEFLQSNWDVFEVVTSPEEMVWTKAQSNCFGGATAAERERWLVPPCRAAATGPIVVQLAGHDVETVTKAALLVLEKSNGKVAGVDLNLGCPQNIARKGRYGAFLMEDQPDTVYQILYNLRRTLPSTCAVSAKIRLPLNPTTQEERIQRLRDTGIDFLTVHGRDLKENKTNVGGIHTDRMRRIVDLAYPLPVVANGGIEWASDVARVLEATGAAAIMTSEAMLERPHFLQINDEASITPHVRFQTQIDVAQSYLDWCRFSPPFPGALGTEMGSFCIVRGHLFKMLYPYLQEHRDIRDTLASRSCHTIQQAQLLISDLRNRYDDISDWDGLRSSSTHSSWYRRHRQANVVVRDTSDKKSPAPAETKLSIEERKILIKRRIELRKSGLAS